MVPKIFLSLVAGLAITLSASSASAAFFGVSDLGGNVFEVTLNGAAGQVATTLADADIQDIIIVGATLSSHDTTSSVFTGKSLGPTNTIVNATTFRVGGSDFGATNAFNSTSVLSLGQFTLSGAPTSIVLGGNNLFTANPGFFQPAIVITNNSGDVLFSGSAPEPASLLLIGLGLGAFAFVRRQKA